MKVYAVVVINQNQQHFVTSQISVLNRKALKGNLFHSALLMQPNTTILPAAQEGCVLVHQSYSSAVWAALEQH